MKRVNHPSIHGVYKKVRPSTSNTPADVTRGTSSGQPPIVPGFVVPTPGMPLGTATNGSSPSMPMIQQKRRAGK